MTDDTMPDIPMEEEPEADTVGSDADDETETVTVLPAMRTRKKKRNHPLKKKK